MKRFITGILFLLALLLVECGDEEPGGLVPEDMVVLRPQTPDQMLASDGRLFVRVR